MTKRYVDVAEPGGAVLLGAWGLWLCLHGPSQFTDALLQISAGNRIIWIVLLMGMGILQSAAAWRGSAQERQMALLFAATLWGGLDGVAWRVLDWRNPACVTLLVWVFMCFAMAWRIATPEKPERQELLHDAQCGSV